MVRINNLEVIQKLVDELKLYPGTDQIPTDLAEKILPCFIINSQEITMTVEPANVVAQEGATNAVNTIYTVPATGKFFLTNAAINVIGGGAAGTWYGALSITPLDGVATDMLEIGIKTIDATTNAGSNNQTLNIPNPIELEPGSLITISSTSASLQSRGMIAGYTSD